MPVKSIAYNFDVSGIDPYVGGSAPLPGGWYLMAITSMDVKENSKKETGHNLALEYTAKRGEQQGRKLFENLNLWHTTSSAAKEIAEKQLSSIGHAVGVLSGGDLNLLGDKDMLVELELTEQQPDTINQTTGETVKGRGPQNRVIQRKAATPENIALYLDGKSQNSGAAPQFNQQAQAAQAAQAPAMNAAPAANPAAQAAQAPAMAQQAPAGAPAANAAPAAAGGPAVPPWQRQG